MESESEEKKTKKKPTKPTVGDSKDTKPTVSDPKETKQTGSESKEIKVIEVKEKRKTELSLKDVIKHTTPFDGSNFAFKEWSNMLERNLILANIDDNFGEILFGAVLINKAKIVWEMAEVSSKVSIKSSFKVLKNAFDNSATRLEAEERIHLTKQASFKSVLEYVKEQVKNCKAVDSKMKEEAVIAHIRRNLSPEFKKQLYLFEFKSMDQFVLALDRVEKNCGHSEKIGSQSEKIKSDVNWVHVEGGRRPFRGRTFRGGNRDSSGRGHGFERNSGARRGRGMANIQCYNCGNFGHTQKHCRSSRQVKLAENTSNSKLSKEVDVEEVLSNKEEDSL